MLFFIRCAIGALKLSHSVVTAVSVHSFGKQHEMDFDFCIRVPPLRLALAILASIFLSLPRCFPGRLCGSAMHERVHGVDCERPRFFPYASKCHIALLLRL